MQYQGYHIAFDWPHLYAPIVVSRTSALEYASVLQSHTLTPVTVPVDRPFIDRPNDPFFEPKLLRELGWSDTKIRDHIIGRSEILEQVVNTNFWVEVILHAHKDDPNFNPFTLFDVDIDTFMELPVSTLLFFSRIENISELQAQKYDGVVCKGMAALRDSVVVISFRSAAMRFGEEERLPL